MSEHKEGRPTKLTETYIKAMEEVLFQDINAIILTDEELWMKINEKLEKAQQIGHRTFELWKANALAIEHPLSKDGLGEEFLRLAKKALCEQKSLLFQCMKSDEKAWQKWAWIIERKFDEWNIRNKNENTVKNPTGEAFKVENIKEMKPEELDGALRDVLSSGQ